MINVESISIIQAMPASKCSLWATPPGKYTDVDEVETVTELVSPCQVLAMNVEELLELHWN